MVLAKAEVYRALSIYSSCYKERPLTENKIQMSLARRGVGRHKVGLASLAHLCADHAEIVSKQRVKSPGIAPQVLLH